MPATMVREAWTDERLDDLSKGVGEVRAEVGELRAEIGQVREGLGEVRAEIGGLKETMEARFDAVDAKFEAMNRTMQIGFGLIGAVLTGILGLIAAQFAAQL
jgi:peptidoglycan hydrolase CwlO-like protein